MLIRQKRFEEVQHLFTAEEKAELHAAQTGETICPAGVVIDEDLLKPALRLKVRTNFPTLPTPAPKTRTAGGGE